MFSKKYISVGILLILFLPFIDRVFNLTEKLIKYKSNEQRTLRQLPEVDVNYLDGYPKLYEEYFNDHFTCRNFFIDQYNTMRVKLFKQSPIPDRAYIGKNGWLYFHNYFHNVRQKVDFSDSQMNLIMKELEKRRDNLREQNCSLYVY